MPVNKPIGNEPWKKGDACLVYGNKLGRVAYVGPMEGKTGNNAGIILEENAGRSNGTAKDKFYFESEKNCGLF
jgi:dynactin complex subunit